MRFMVIVKATKDSEAGKMPSEGLLSAMAKFNEEDGEGRRDDRWQWVAAKFQGRSSEVLRRQAQRDRRPIHGDQGIGSGLLDLAM